MPEPVPQTAPRIALERAQRRATRAVVVTFLTLTVVFILVSTWELAEGAFAVGARPLDSSGAPEARACTSELESLRQDLDRAVAVAGESGAPEAEQAFATALGPRFSEGELARVEGVCKRVPRGLSAMGALLRLRRAEEAALARRRAEVAPLRAELGAYLPAK